MFKIFTNSSDWIWDGISNLLHSVNPNVVLTLAVICLVYYFLRNIRRLRQKINPVAADLKRANAALNFKKNHEQCFYHHYEEISAKLEAIPNISHHWKEFKEHVILPTDDEATTQDANQLKIKNSVPPSYFFSEEKFIERPIDLRYVDAVPGKLVAMGVLFTFVGLSIGIASATHALGGLEGALDTPELNKSLVMLLKGASLAFITSVIGIALSLLYSLMEKSTIKNVKKSLNAFVDSLDRSLSFITSEQIHLQIRDATKEQSKKLDGFSNELAISLGNVISKPFDESFNKVADAIVELKNIQQNFSEHLMNTLIDKMSGNISSQAQHNQQQAAETFANVQQSLTQQAETMVVSQNEMVASFEKLLESSTASIEKNSSIQATYQEIIERQQDVVAKFSEISQAIKDTNIHMSETSQENKTAASAFREAADQVSAAMQETSALWRTYDTKFKDTDESMTKNFNHFEKCTQHFHQIVELYVNNLTREFQKAIDTLGAQVEEFADAREIKAVNDRSS